MARKPTLTEVTTALEEAARVATRGSPAERSGQIALPDEAPREDEGDTGDALVLYESGKGLRVELSFTGATMWATQQQIADLFGITRPNVTMHLRNIFAEGELDAEGTCKESLHVGVSGQSYTRMLYNLDAIISVGYRVNSRQGTMFRRWATDKLVQYAVKGFAIDDERLKEPGGNDYFAELRQRVRDIRAAEANVYKELREVCALCADYDPTSQQARNFFMAMQNKMLWAAASGTAPEIVVDRADANQPNMGLHSWKGRDVTKADVTVAKNYLAPGEIDELNRLTNMTLDYFDDQARMQRVVNMVDLEQKLGEFLRFNNRSVLTGLGSISRQAADDHAEAEYAKFDAARRLKRQQEGEAAIGKLLALDREHGACARRGSRKPKGA